jgi:hypothetical protein
MRTKNLTSVMPVPGLDPGIVAGIHVFLAAAQQDVDVRDKPGHDFGVMAQLKPAP